MISVWRRAQSSPVLVVGERYGYRARAIDELTAVTMLKEGTKKPARVLVRFDDPAMEGREQWVPPTRLKVAWTDIEAFRAEEARWDAVTSMSPHQDSAEVTAAEQVCELLIPEDIASFGYRDAYLVVHDPSALARLAAVNEDAVGSHPASLTNEDGTLIVPWPVVLDVVQRIVARDPDPVMAVVAQEEAKARYEAIHGHRYASTGRNREEFYIEPDRCVEYDQDSPWGAPKRALLRQWAGDAAQRWDELVELRKEIKRVGDIAEAAIAELRSHGHSRDADRLATQLGLTVEMLRHDPD